MLTYSRLWRFWYEVRYIVTYVPRDIINNLAQVIWILENIHTLKSGVWPESVPSGELTMMSHSSHASFENACLVAAEIEIRVQRCGLDGYLVGDKYALGQRMTEEDRMTEEQIARKRHMYVSKVHNIIKSVLDYCASGHKQRIESYQEFKRRTHSNRKYRKEFPPQIVART